MSEQQIPNVSDDAVTGLQHDPVQGATISEHDPVETVDHPHVTSDDTAGEPAEDDGHVGGDGQEHEHTGTGEVSQGVEVTPGAEGTVGDPSDGQEPTEPVEGTGTPTDGQEAGSGDPAASSEGQHAGPPAE